MNHNPEREKKELWFIINTLSLLFIFIVGYFMFSMQAVGKVASDTPLHIAYMDQYFHGKTFIPHPLWHIGTWYVSKFLEVKFEVAAALFTAAVVTLYAVTIYKVAKAIDEQKNGESLWYLITFIVLAIGPFFWVDYYPRIYMGPGSPSVWHNVTLLMVKPLALLSVFFTVRYLSDGKNLNFFWAILVTILSIFAKPNFIIVFLPSLVVFVLLKRYFSKKQLLFVLAAILLSVLALAYQFIGQYKGGSHSTGGGIVFDFLGVWSIYTPSVFVSIAMALGLPFLISLFNYSTVKENDYIKFTWLLVLFSTIIFSCFAESGKRYADGNFSWSWMISLGLIYIFTIIEYFRQYRKMLPLVRYSLLILILYQVYVGWYYLIEMFNGVAFNQSLDHFPFFQ